MVDELLEISRSPVNPLEIFQATLPFSVTIYTSIVLPRDAFGHIMVLGNSRSILDSRLILENLLRKPRIENRELAG